MWYQNSDGDYEIAGGSPRRTDPVSREVWFRLTTPLGSWVDDSELGSNLHTLIREKTADSAAKKVPAIVFTALKPMTDAGLLKELKVETQVVTAEQLLYRV